jgi:hypothetical protein
MESSMANRTALWLCLIGLAATLPGRAQDESPTTGLPQLVVVDSTNLSSYRGHLLSWRSADALALAVEGEGRWEIVPRRQVRREIATRGFLGPLSFAHAQLLGDVLGAGFALRGTVQSCDVADPGGSVRLTMLVELIDVKSGEIVSAQTVQGSANASANETEILDVQVGRALAKAADDAARMLPVFRRLKGMVYALVGKRKALINVGREHGLKNGVELTVYRESYEEAERAETLTAIGRVKIVEINATDATVTILKGSQPLQRQDFIQTVLPVGSPAREDRAR